MKSALPLLGLAMLAACASNDDDAAAPQVEVVRSSLARDTNPELTADETTTLTKSQAAFAVDIYKTVAKDKASDNVFLSPHSIAIALGMAYAGARGETASEMKQALHFDLPDDRLHKAFDHLDLALASRGKTAVGKDGKPFRLNVTNSVWGQKSTPFEAPFLDTLAVNYGAGLNIVDFIGATEKARTTINAWTEEKTEKRIKDILGPGAVNADTRLVLVNAVYFNAAWATKFLEPSTAPAPFTKLDGTSMNVSMMHGKVTGGYVKTDAYEAVEMPYDGNELSMIAIAPTAGTFATFESALTGDKVLDVLAGLQPREVNLGFPKLKVEGDFGLKSALQTLGMKRAFDGADFSGITASERLSVRDVLHKTFLEIDENGTEAAAATAIVFERTSVGIDPLTVTIDRPFITAIVDRATKTLVFLGRVTEPKAP